jgi:hypothetical protein
MSSHYPPAHAGGTDLSCELHTNYKSVLVTLLVKVLFLNWFSLKRWQGRLAREPLAGCAGHTETPFPVALRSKMRHRIHA